MKYRIIEVNPTTLKNPPFPLNLGASKEKHFEVEKCILGFWKKEGYQYSGDGPTHAYKFSSYEDAVQFITNKGETRTEMIVETITTR